jgi:acetate kinase
MPNVLTINGGSSSIRFAFFAAGQPMKRLLQGKMERIGSDDATLIIDHGGARPPTAMKVGAKGRATAIGFLLDWLESQTLFETVEGVGHRVVHGMQHADPERVTANLLDELKRMVPFDPEHLPSTER